MSGTDWALVILTAACLVIIALAVGYLWGMSAGLKVWEGTAEEWTKRRAKLAEENKRLRNDLNRQLNKQFEL